MSQKFPLSGFKWIENTSKFLENYNEDSEEGYFLEIAFQILEELHAIHNDLPYLPEIKKVEKLVANLDD